MPSRLFLSDSQELTARPVVCSKLRIDRDDEALPPFLSSHGHAEPSALLLRHDVIAEKSAGEDYFTRGRCNTRQRADGKLLRARSALHSPTFCP